MTPSRRSRSTRATVACSARTARRSTSRSSRRPRSAESPTPTSSHRPGDDPELLHLPRLALAPDPEVEIRKSLTVMMIPKTNLIQVAMSSESASEAAEIVNAVIEAYLKVALDSGEEEAESDAGGSARSRRNGPSPSARTRRHRHAGQADRDR